MNVTRAVPVMGGATQERERQQEGSGTTSKAAGMAGRHKAYGQAQGKQARQSTDIKMQCMQEFLLHLSSLSLFSAPP